MLGPLVIVVLLSMIKDAYEDYKRHKSDDAENNTQAIVFHPLTQQWENKPWHSIKVGDVIKVTSESKFIPADIMLLHSKGPEGVCYVETKNLDGETNLKMKQTPSVLNQTYSNNKQIAKLNGVI